MKEYIISKIEIKRRKKAFITLSVSLVIGLALASKILDFPIPIVNYLYFAIALFLSGGLFFKSFDFLSHIKIILSDHSLKRINRKTAEDFPIDGVVKIKIKRTTKNTIREIYIWFLDGKSVFITALKNFDQFKDDLINRVGKNIATKEMREPIDFDHPLFYSILGLPISFIGIYLIKLIGNLDYAKIQMALVIFFFYLLLVGIYFIYAKPISRRYGNKTQIIDFALGIFMICAGIMCIVALG